MTDAATLELEHASAATAPTWFSVTFRGACTSFRDRDAAYEYAARVQIRFGVKLLVTTSDTIPGYEH